MKRMQDLSHQVAIVTGASAGIGAATAAALARRGVHLALAARRADRLEALAAELRQEHGVETLVLTTDMAQRAQINAMVQATLAHFGRIDILINNAGVGLQGDAMQLDETQLRYLFEVNVFGPIFAMQAVAPIMARQGSGVIVNVSSILGKVAVPSLGSVGSSAGYTASKFALGSFAAAARMELAAQHVRVVTVLPGVTATEFNTAFLTPPGAPTPPPRRRAGLLGLMPATRVGERIVDAIARGEREVYITGKDRLVVLGATAFPGLWEWGLTRLRAWRMADKGRWLRVGGLLLGALALGVALGAGILKRLFRG